MTLTPRQAQLFDFVKSQHGDQKRKYTGEPYTNHLLNVAELVSKYEPNTLAVEIALCHDLFEDTKCDYKTLFNMLSTHYASGDVWKICSAANELTDHFTHQEFPDLNRKQRKFLEADRLSRISPLAQSIKYADLIDNCISIVDRDPEFAVIYLQEKLQILDKMRAGNINLFILACFVYRSSIERLGKN